MKLKNGYSIVKENDIYLIKPLEKTVMLSEIGALLWNETSKADLNNNDLLNLLLDNFEISTVLALGEIDTFIKICKENGLFE